MGDTLKNNYKVYIIGNSSGMMNEDYVRSFKSVQKRLESRGFVVVNPLGPNPDSNYTENAKSNFVKLIESNAVFVMGNVPIKAENTELKIASDLNMLVIQDSIVIR